MSEQAMACCGTRCDECEYFPVECSGCAAIEGRVFWTAFTGEGETCPIYDCCVRGKGLAHCGLCDELPCARYETSDPTKSDEENAADFMRQMENLMAATNEVECGQAKAAALRVLRAPGLAGKVCLEGGLVPWVLGGGDSGRSHGDVDFSVHLADMPAVRAWLEAEGLYDPDLDSRLLPCNAAAEEFGAHARVDGVLASFAPFFRRDGMLVQRNAQHRAFAGYDALLEATIEGLAEEDFVEVRELPDGTRAGFSTVEACRAAKLASARPKDFADMAEFDRLGWDEARMERVMEAFATMEVTCPAHGE